MKKAATRCLTLTMLLASGALFAQTTFTATLNEGQVVGGGTGSAATGSAVLTLSASGDSLTYSISLVGLDLDGLQTPLDATDDVTAFHFHNAPAGSNGGVVFGLISPAHDPDDIVIDAVAGTLTGIWENTDVNPLSARLANLLAGELYLNVHTVAFGGGEIRGQVQGVLLTPTSFSATLDQGQVVGGGTGSAATGSAVLTLSASGDSLTYSISLVGLDLDGLQTPLDATDDVTAFHFHNAPAGSNGGVVFGLISPAHDPDDIVIDAVAGTLTGIWENTDVNPLSARLANLLAGELYLNVHTVAFGGGEIRGQVLIENIFADGFEAPPPI